MDMDMVQVESEVGQKRTNFLIVRSSTFVEEAGMGEDVVGWGGVGVGVGVGGWGTTASRVIQNKTVFYELEHMFIVFKRILFASLPYP